MRVISSPSTKDHYRDRLDHASGKMIKSAQTTGIVKPIVPVSLGASQAITPTSKPGHQ
ncbi:hypothetical protein [Vibrio splendidus]|uniref:hypothetical protein n=1 Tax=Vibrio splendidus TaxID=29497 RepID=UPI00223696FC|nr:hypothetical protein [Vibrio splendidus]